MASPAAAQSARVLVVQMQNDSVVAPLSTHLTRSINRYLEQRVAVVPPRQLQQAVRRNRPATLNDVVTLARTLNASHILVVSVATGGNMRQRAAVTITLVDTGSGMALSNITSQATRGALSRGEVGKLLSWLGTTLAAAPPAVSAAPPATAPPATVASAPAAPDAVPASNSGLALRPAARFGVGIAWMQRDARLLSSPDTTLQLPCYCGANGGSGPYFAAAHLGAEWFPWLFLGKDGPPRGSFGFAFDLLLANGRYAIPGGQVQSATFVDMAVLATMRYVWWSSPRAPDVTAQVGFRYLSFPLVDADFPGLSYAAPYLGAGVHIPLGLEQIVLIGQAHLSPLGRVSGGALGIVRSGVGYGADAGLRFAIAAFEVTLLYRYERYLMDFENATVVVDITPVTTNISLRDAYTQLIFDLGFKF